MYVGSGKTFNSCTDMSILPMCTSVANIKHTRIIEMTTISKLTGAMLYTAMDRNITHMQKCILYIKM